MSLDGKAVVVSTAAGDLFGMSLNSPAQGDRSRLAWR